MAIWYVRTDTSHSATRNGTSYATAWGGWTEVVWGVSGVSLSDTLYVCGAYASSTFLSVGAHLAASTAQQVTLRGDYAGDPAIFTFTGTGYLNSARNYTTIKGMKVNGMTGFSCILHTAIAGGIIENCELVGGSNGVGLGSNVAYTSYTVRNNVIHGQTNIGINHTIGTASLTPTGILISGNTVYAAAVYGIQFVVNSAAWTTSRFDKCAIRGNTVRDCPGGSVYFITCNNDTTTAPTIYSTDIEVSGNTIDRCGTIAGDSGKHGGITVMGAAWPMIFNNTVRDTYVTGAGIQTAKNIQPQIFNNTVSGIRSGTPTVAFQSGFPIDGNGIFFDNLTVGGLAYGNHISDLVNTGIPSSGVGLAIWDCQNVTYTGNIVMNCSGGITYGKASENNNAAYNNTIIDCDVGVIKVGTTTLAGNVSVKNNIFLRCTTGFSSGTNPAINADYNCIHGATTPYSGISAGANDKLVDPKLDNGKRPTEATLIRAGTSVNGKDFNGKLFYSQPNIGAVDDNSLTPRRGFVRQQGT